MSNNFYLQYPVSLQRFPLRSGYCRTFPNSNRITFLLVLAIGLTQLAYCFVRLSASFPTCLTSTALCYALPPHSTHSTQLYRSPLHCRCSLAPFISHNVPVLSVTSCRLPPASRRSQFPLFLRNLNSTRLTAHVLHVTLPYTFLHPPPPK